MIIKYIELASIPKLLFAHTFSADFYQADIRARPNRIEITYISAGGYHYNQNESEGDVKCGDILCNTYTAPLKICANNFHSHHTVCFELPYSVAENESDTSIPIPFTIPASDADKEIIPLIDKIIAESTINSSNRLICVGLFMQLLGNLSKCTQNQLLNIRHSDIKYVDKAKVFIYQNLNKPIKQSTVAKELGISPEYLSTIFKKVEGIPLMTYINRTKLEKIRSIMIKENIRLYQAAEMFGYSDPNYVSYLYKKYFHMNITDQTFFEKE
ncbi:MAG: helix-turn-helix transcriptional regulator [Clostridiales bacterium]|nr:helix-turn-helix transcriptional regulator [Clostridiales bacterium]